MGGNQSRGLIQASKTRGWDPTVVPAGNGQPAVDLSKLDVDPGNINYGDCLGRAPFEIPDQTQGVENGYDVNIGGPATTFNSPELRENVNRRTRGAKPTPGMPGA